MSTPSANEPFARSAGSETLFELEPSVSGRVRAAGEREARRLQVRQWKSEFKMFAYKGCAPDWLALSMTECIEALDGYDLTEEERTNGVDLLAGYCRLLDEANLVEYGSTEYEACRKIAERLGAAGRCAPDRERKSPNNGAQRQSRAEETP